MIGFNTGIRQYPDRTFSGLRLLNSRLCRDIFQSSHQCDDVVPTSHTGRGAPTSPSPVPVGSLLAGLSSRSPPPTAVPSERMRAPLNAAQAPGQLQRRVVHECRAISSTLPFVVTSCETDIPGICPSASWRERCGCRCVASDCRLSCVYKSRDSRHSNWINSILHRQRIIAKKGHRRYPSSSLLETSNTPSPSATTMPCSWRNNTAYSGAQVQSAPVQRSGCCGRRGSSTQRGGPFFLRGRCANRKDRSGQQPVGQVPEEQKPTQQQGIIHRRSDEKSGHDAPSGRPSTEFAPPPPSYETSQQEK